MEKAPPEKYNEKAAKARFDEVLGSALEVSRRPMMTATQKRRALKKRPGKGVQSR
jgi:hypothetical protein